MNNILDSFRVTISKLNKELIEELKLVNQDICFVIRKQIKDEKIIEHLFDKLLDLLNYFGDDIENSYYVLLDYYKNINLDATRFYEQMYLEALDIECIPISQKKKYIKIFIN